MTTIQDVAALAGVSVSSVSNVLNGRTDRLGRETFQRVQDAIRELNYRPNLVARQLKTGYAPLIGLLVPSTANPMFGELAVHVETAARDAQGFRVLLGNTHRDREQESRIFDDLIALGVRGVILASSRTDEGHLEAAIARGLAVVSYDRGGDGDARSHIDHVSPDNMLASRLAVDHLVAHGHRRLALATPDVKTVSRKLKRQGFLQAAQEAGVGRHAQVLEGTTGSGYGDSNLADEGYAMAGRIAAMQARPTGIIAINDMMAMGLMAGLHRAGLAVPRDVSVIGMDNLVMTAYANPPLTTVEMPSAEMARAMVSMVVERLAQPELPAREVLFQPRLVERQSVAAPPPDSASPRPRARPPRKTSA
ncbi:LacI family DNA-binding transcriptional regulator [Bordetella genomosp. 11]|uniref:LacI family transcriptional regulator n=1 Tax=Bordetella genomosp. 11 TaxID=1416808 RepID=A0A261UM67_9BORD|nr:LacI family DNA-binding transcriptional regulator [Bordetella genomosp. 11]OZI62370.1 LacI family transcriptional regulator [Bordetella genomosp. 11]